MKDKTVDSIILNLNEQNAKLSEGNLLFFYWMRVCFGEKTVYPHSLPIIDFFSTRSSSFRRVFYHNVSFKKVI